MFAESTSVYAVLVYRSAFETYDSRFDFYVSCIDLYDPRFDE